MPCISIRPPLLVLDADAGCVCCVVIFIPASARSIPPSSPPATFPVYCTGASSVFLAKLAPPAAIARPMSRGDETTALAGR